MSTRTRTANAYESSLNGSITNSATSFAVVSGAGLVQPMYLVIEPDVPALREFIRVGVIAGNNFSSVTRGLTGSTAGAQAHSSGAIVRTVVTSQLVGDIFTDIEAVEASGAAHYAGTDVADHPEATTSVRGFISAADKTKLDALAAANQVTGGNAHDHAGGDGAQISHSGLSALTTGDPHTQYVLHTALIAAIVDTVRTSSLAETADDASLSASWENGASIAFTKPAAWATYELMAWGDVTFHLLAAGLETCLARMDISANQGDIGQGAMAANQEIQSVPCQHRRTGLSGDVTVTIQYSGSSGDMSKTGSQLCFIARRLT